MSRYRRSYDFDFGALKPREQPKPKRDASEDILRLVSGVAPAAGTLIGAGLGGPAGAAIGASVGTGAGVLGTGIADWMGRDEKDEAARRAAEEEERAAQHRAALSLLGGF